MTEIPPDFDWVKARYECSAEMVFGSLKTLTQQHVATRNTQLGHERYKFEDGGYRFGVYEVARAQLAQASFNLDKGTSVIHAYTRVNGQVTEADYTTALNDRGQCRLRVGDNSTPLDFWQVLKATLEPLLFK